MGQIPSRGCVSVGCDGDKERSNGICRSKKSEAASSGFIEATSPAKTDRTGKCKNLDCDNLDSKEREAERCFKTCISHGSISVIGRGRALDDAVMVVPGVVDCGGCGSYDFFGVYHGHGRAPVATACRDKMHEMLAAAVETNRRVMDGGNVGGLRYWKEVMKVCFENMDMEVLSMVDKKAELKAMGSTAAVVLVGEKEIVVANCGDSRVVLCHDGLAIPLSQDHKVYRHDEGERMDAGDGSCINGVSATSRSKGNYHLKPYVISEPKVTVRKRTESNEFLVIATDGLWDVVSNEMACDVVKMCFAEQIKRNFEGRFRETCSAGAAETLVQLALARGSKDNVSVIVVELKKLNPKLLD